MLVAVPMASPVMPGAAQSQEDDSRIIAEATDGRLKGSKGRLFDTDCNQWLDYEAEVIDLNRDGQPEVFTQIHGTCWGGHTGVHMNLFIKDRDGQWQPQFGFPGIYRVMETGNQGFPDIEVGGPGTCFPVWRWTGARYEIHRTCPR